MDSDGKATYHVVDGKQRLDTIIRFAHGRLRIAADYDDVTLAGKRFRELTNEQKETFWNYSLTVEEMRSVDLALVHEIFVRWNKNVSKLNRQELRHASYAGWLLSTVESDIDTDDFWKVVKVSPRGRSSRMKDAQSVLEMFLLIILREAARGQNQDFLDEMCATYETEADLDFDVDTFRQSVKQTKSYIRAMEDVNACVTAHARTSTHFYTLWGVVAFDADALPAPEGAAERYAAFMTHVDSVRSADDPSAFIADMVGEERAAYVLPGHYAAYSKAAPTHLGPRKARHNALAAALMEGGA